MERKTRLVAGLAACVVVAVLMVTGVVSEGVGLVIGTIAVLSMAAVHSPSGRRDDEGGTP